MPATSWWHIAGGCIGGLRIEDVLRPEAVEAVARIRDMGLEVMLLTGDRHEIAEKVARQLGVREFGAELLPEQKLRRVKKLMASGKRVAMVGDGINDAPALARATVGIAMGSGTDLARQSASVLLLGNHLVDFAELLNIARRCRRIILFNFAGTLGVDAVGVVLGGGGHAQPAAGGRPARLLRDGLHPEFRAARAGLGPARQPLLEHESRCARTPCAAA